MLSVMKKNLLTVLLALALLAFVYIGVTNIRSTNQKIQLKNIELKSREAKLIELNIKYDEVIHLQTKTEQEKAKQLEQIKTLEEERKRLETELQAKRHRQQQEKERLAVAAQKASGVQKAYAVSGNCEAWKAQAGIASTPATRALIGGESGCRPNAVNPSSGACGIPQALPCSKMPCTLQDPVCQLRWMDQYVAARYGTWDNAYATWLSRSPHWY